MRRKNLFWFSICFLIFSILTLFTGGCTKESIVEEEKGYDREGVEYRQRFSSRDLIYLIMIDRFYDGDPNHHLRVKGGDLRGYHGGNLRGIIKKLDYIKSLGATAIWITPVAENEEGGYHGYWIQDFYRVDPRIGTLGDLKELVEEAHKREIKVLLDYVVNHTGYQSPWLQDEKYRKWFHPRRNITNWNDQQQLEEGWLMGLPDLNQNHPEVRQFFIENALWWIEETGIDGMRLDTVKHVPKDFWIEFIHEIKSRYPDFYFLGEVWHESPRYLQQYKEIGFDGITHFPFYYAICNTFTQYGKTNSLIHAIRQDSIFTQPQLNGIFIDNHDTKRFMTAVRGEKEAYFKQALTFLMTYPAIPILYYGTEIGMEGGEDPDNRRYMEWERVETSEILDFYRKLVHLRNNHPAIVDGDFQLLDYDPYFLSYKRYTDRDTVLVVMNIQNKGKNVEITVGQEEKYQDFLTGNFYFSEEGRLEIQLEALELLILIKRE